MRITFLGACRTVTGSMHLVEADGIRFLVDAGMFQGENEELNWEDLAFDPASIDHVILTHAHIDHIGLLPRLVREGFRGQVITHRATLDLAGLMLEDSVQVQKEDLATENRRRLRRGLPELRPLYDENDLRKAMRLFRHGINYGDEIELGRGLSLTLHDAGHILGSAFVEIDYRGKRVIFSGDVGNTGKPVIRDPSTPRKANLLVMESTYGDRLHGSINETVEQLGRIIAETFERGGNVIVPSFALERAQDIIYYLRELYEAGKLPDGRYFLDSPLAIDAMNVFRAHPESYDQEARDLFLERRDLFVFPGLRFTRTPEESKSLNSLREKAVIIASGGMCVGGRIKHHLKHHLWREENSIVFTGYQAKGTLGRDIAEGAKEVEIYWERIAVRAQVHMLDGFSAHADQKGLMDWCSAAEPEEIILVHGEPGAQDELIVKLAERGIRARAAERGDVQD
ncbi:MAG: MBL fold metallo-hydrolase RNA specificity domain-containing protein [candidate division WOR-3 bacterium]